MEFDIQNLFSGGGMAQAGHGTSVNYTCSSMSSGSSVYLIDTWPFLASMSEIFNQFAQIFPNP
jgi:hypothetical protein